MKAGQKDISQANSHFLELTREHHMHVNVGVSVPNVSAHFRESRPLEEGVHVLLRFQLQSFPNGVLNHGACHFGFVLLAHLIVRVIWAAVTWFCWPCSVHVVRHDVGPKPGLERTLIRRSMRFASTAFLCFLTSVTDTQFSVSSFPNAASSF